ncbi:hypothetical protein HMPREF0577_1874 [Mobiluncus mulieris ATCC 35243]|nr:hypothetical protein HMPREF0577_1874 [Mobiluncus mulieris ATCC 35243]
MAKSYRPTQSTWLHRGQPQYEESDFGGENPVLITLHFRKARKKRQFPL